MNGLRKAAPAAIIAKADWYVWADPKADGSPPSNWQSVFGGPAWTWDARRQQYYLHNFLSSQPQVNGHNPEVQEALLGAMQFWLDRGVDGFRVDALNFLMHDPQLRDNPPAPPSDKPRTRPFDFQRRVHNQSHPDIPLFIARIRELTDRYDAVFTVAEVGGDEAEAEMKAFTQGDTHLNSAYGFNFLYADKLTPGLVCGALAQWPDEDGVGWPSWAFENHDAPRALSRWCAPEHRDAFARLKIALLACAARQHHPLAGRRIGPDPGRYSVRPAARPRSDRQLAADPVARRGPHPDAVGGRLSDRRVRLGRSVATTRARKHREGRGPPERGRKLAAHVYAGCSGTPQPHACAASR